MKPSEIFEGENSSLRKTYDNSMNTDKLREEFKDFYYETGKFQGRELGFETYFNFWIKKLEEQEAGHQKQLEEIAEEIESKKVGNELSRQIDVFSYHNNSLQDALSIIRSHIK